MDKWKILLGIVAIVVVLAVMFIFVLPMMLISYTCCALPFAIVLTIALSVYWLVNR